MRITAKKLKKEWGVTVDHALYNHVGTWYHHLERFPAALFDSHGYVRFENRDSYLHTPGLKHGEHLHVDGGIRNLPGYVAVKSER